MSPELAASLVALGFIIGVYASATGTGGGFLIAPLLLIRYPEVTPAAITAASLSVVLLSSGTQSLIVIRERRTDYVVALAMAGVTVPAALLGALSTTVLPREAFAIIFAVLLFSVGTYVLVRPIATISVPTRRWGWRRDRTDSDGNRYLYRIPLLSSAAPSAGSGFIAALTGIGGGPIGVPIMTRVMHVPHAIAVPTMHLVIVIQTVFVLSLHVLLSSPGDPMRDVPWLGAGVILAGPAGAWVRRRYGEGLLMRALAVGLFLIAIRTGLDIVL
jgi:uncharacterized protein